MLGIYVVGKENLRSRGTYLTKGKKPPLRPLGGGHPVGLLQTGG